MTFEEAVSRCHVRSAIYRLADPKIKYWKNHTVPLEKRVPLKDQLCLDWKEHDPRDEDAGSLFMYND